VGRRNKSSLWLDYELKADEAMSFCGGKGDTQAFCWHSAAGGALHRMLGLGWLMYSLARKCRNKTNAAFTPAPQKRRARRCNRTHMTAS
jgi:hypothetical protein